MRYVKRFDPKTISVEQLLNELKNLAKKLGRVPSRSDMAKGTNITKKLYLYGRKFGGLTDACVKAGLVANKGGKYAKYTDKELLDYLLELKQFLNRTPTQGDIDKAGKYASGAYKRHFGTYNKALAKLNIRHNIKRGISAQKITDDIVGMSVRLNRSPEMLEFSKLSSTVSGIMACKKLNCGKSWNKVLKKCGLPIVYNKNLSETELKKEVERLRVQMNRIPGYYDMVQLGHYSPETYARRFGSYLKALNHFGYDYTPQSQWHNQIFTKGNDGTLYKSKFEANIANSLFKLSALKKVSSYEYEKQVCQDRQWTCDFFIMIGDKEIWLEADGMGENRNDPYSIENEKINFYKDNDYAYIVIPYKKMNLNKYIERALVK